MVALSLYIKAAERHKEDEGRGATKSPERRRMQLTEEPSIHPMYTNVYQSHWEGYVSVIAYQRSRLWYYRIR